MKTEFCKIGVACFIGGALGCIVALVASPAYWILGLIAGFSGGYISYEFREVLRAIPIAFNNAKVIISDSWYPVAQYLAGAIKGTESIIREPHPILYPVLLGFLGLSYLIYQETIVSAWWALSSLFQIIYGIGSYLCFSIILMFAASVILAVFILAGRKKDLSLIYSNTDISDSFDERLEYAQAIYYFSICIWLIFLASFKLLVRIPRGIRRCCCFGGLFIWNLFKLIHSHKRLLCGVDSAFGCLMSLLIFESSATSSLEQAMLVLFGGLIGAVLGILNWEIVSKRILCLAPVNGRA